MAGTRVHLEDVDRALRLVLGLSVAAATVACVTVLIAGFDLTLGLSAAVLTLLAGLGTGGFGVTLLRDRPPMQGRTEGVPAPSPSASAPARLRQAR